MNIRISRIFMGILIIFYTFGANVSADTKSTVTDHLFNGRMWQLLNYSQKTIHLTGIQEGIMLCLTQMKEDLLIPPATMELMKASGLFDRRRLMFSSQGVSNIADRVDIFYGNTNHLAIPIIEAYRHVTLKLNFAAPEDLAQDLALPPRLALRMGYLSTCVEHSRRQVV